MAEVVKAGALVHAQAHAGRRNRAAWLAAAALAGAALVKLIPLLLLVGWLRRFGAWWLAGAVGLFLGGYGGYILTQHQGVSNFLVTYLKDEKYNAPVYYFLTQAPRPALGLRDGDIRLALAAALGLTAGATVLKPEHGPYDFIGNSFVLVTAYLLLATNAHPWYATWLLLFVPLFLPPGGVPFGAGPPVPERVRWVRGDYGLYLRLRPESAPAAPGDALTPRR